MPFYPLPKIKDNYRHSYSTISKIRKCNIDSILLSNLQSLFKFHYFPSNVQHHTRHVDFPSVSPPLSGTAPQLSMISTTLVCLKRMVLLCSKCPSIWLFAVPWDGMKFGLGDGFRIINEMLYPSQGTTSGRTGCPFPRY